MYLRMYSYQRESSIFRYICGLSITPAAPSSEHPLRYIGTLKSAMYYELPNIPEILLRLLRCLHRSEQKRASERPINLIEHSSQCATVPRTDSPGLNSLSSFINRDNPVLVGT